MEIYTTLTGITIMFLDEDNPANIISPALLVILPLNFITSREYFD